MQRPEAALFCGALDGYCREDSHVAANREVLEDEARLSGADKLIQYQRLNLSRKPLTAASSEIAEVADLHGRVGLAKHIAL